MLRRQKADQSFNVDQRIYDTKKPWVAGKRYHHQKIFGAMYCSQK